MNSALKFRVNNAVNSERRGEETRLMVLARSHLSVKHKLVSDLPSFLKKGDVLVVNDAATLPASLKGKFGEEEIELRLLQPIGLSPLKSWRAVIFGKGDWRTPTEKRGIPPEVKAGDILTFGEDFTARIKSVESEISNRLLIIEFSLDGSELWQNFFSHGKPIQYSYLKEDLKLWDQQTIFAGPPVALEPPSASFPITWGLLERLIDQGVEILKITHATGVSNTGDPKVDALLPLTERSSIEKSVQERILKAKKGGRQIVALGTGVVRALESWGGEKVTDENFLTSLKINAQTQVKVATALITGFHEPQASHLHLLAAFVDRATLEAAYLEASENGYLWHEYGDLCLML